MNCLSRHENANSILRAKPSSRRRILFKELSQSKDTAGSKRSFGYVFAGGWSGAPDGPNAWGLCFDEENNPAPYCAASADYPCKSGVSYHGRGPMQLSW
jgi:hypothetical protein